MKKVLSILLAATAIALMVSCNPTSTTNTTVTDNSSVNGDGNGSGNGDNNGGGNSGNNGGDNGGSGTQATKLSNTKFYKLRDFSGETTETTVTFGNGNEVEYHVVWNWLEGGSDYEATGDVTYRGTYTYKDTGSGNILKGEGTLTMKDINDSSKEYTTQYYADGDNLKIMNAAPNGDSINLEKIKE